jgi:hypothetical protein
MNQRKSYTKKKLDYEVGHLSKSPCRSCGTYYRFPRCIDDCDTLDRIQTHLAQGISCTRNYSAMESFRVQLESRRGK